MARYCSAQKESFASRDCNSSSDNLPLEVVRLSLIHIWAIVEKKADEYHLLDKGVNIVQEGVKIEKGIESSKAADVSYVI